MGSTIIQYEHGEVIMYIEPIEAVKGAYVKFKTQLCLKDKPLEIDGNGVKFDEHLVNCISFDKIGHDSFAVTASNDEMVETNVICNDEVNGLLINRYGQETLDYLNYIIGGGHDESI